MTTPQKTALSTGITAQVVPCIRAYLEPARFSGFRLAYGELVWGDYELCFPVMDLYRNTIEHNDMLSEAA